MFQKRTSQIAAIAALLCLTTMSTASYAEGPVAPAAQAQSVKSSHSLATKISSVKDMSLVDIRRETKTKMSETRQWVKDTKVEQNIEFLMNDLGQATDKLQDKVAPAGNVLKSFIRKNLPGKKLVEAGDRPVSFYGILLIISFGIVVFLMSISGPTSRLGGRH